MGAKTGHWKLRRILPLLGARAGASSKDVELMEDWLREERALHSEPLGPETGNVIGVFTRPRLVGTDKSEETWQDRIA